MTPPEFNLRRIATLAAIAIAAVGVHWALTWEMRLELAEVEDAYALQSEELAIALARSEEMREYCASTQQRARLSEQTLQHARGLLDDCNAPTQQLDPKQELYRLLLDPEQPQKIAVFSLAVQAGVAHDEWVYTLVLYQARKHNEIKGTYDLVIEGEMDGADTSIVLSVQQPDKKRAFKFRYFENLEGTFTMPAQFAPKRVLVQLDVSGDAQIETRHPWKGVLGANGEETAEQP